MERLIATSKKMSMIIHNPFEIIWCDLISIVQPRLGELSWISLVRIILPIASLLFSSGSSKPGNLLYQCIYISKFIIIRGVELRSITCTWEYVILQPNELQHWQVSWSPEFVSQNVITYDDTSKTVCGIGHPLQLYRVL